MGWGMPEVYIPLLFLAHEGRGCQLRQEEFFGDIWVQLCHPEEAGPTAGSAGRITGGVFLHITILRSIPVPKAACLLYQRFQLLERYAMDVSYYVLESAALPGNPFREWSRWLTIVLLGLPWMFPPRLRRAGRSLKARPFTGIYSLEEAGLAEFSPAFSAISPSGYIVRLLKGVLSLRSSNNWPLLCLDGMKVPRHSARLDPGAVQFLPLLSIT